MPSKKISKKRRPKAEGIVANDVLRKFNLKKHCVRDDGRCWIYVIMAKLNMYKAIPKRGLACAGNPTAEEQFTAQSFCELIKDQFPDIVKAPDYAGKRDVDDFFGTYGGTEQWQTLCDILNLTIILWDPRETSNMQNSNHKFVTIQRVGSKGILKFKNAAEIMALCDSSDGCVVHVAWSNTIDEHFDVYL